MHPSSVLRLPVALPRSAPHQPCPEAWLSPADIHLDLPCVGPAHALQLLACCLARRLHCPSEALLRRLQAREALGSTALGFGLALPHAPLPGLKSPLGVCLGLRAPVPWPEGEPVRWVVGLLLPVLAPQQQLQHVGALAARGGDPLFRRLLDQARTPAAVWKLLTLDDHPDEPAAKAS